MNLKDLSRLINECNEDVEYVIESTTNILPQRKTRLTENLVTLDPYIDKEQKKQIKLAIDMIDNSIAFKAIKDAETLEALK